MSKPTRDTNKAVERIIRFLPPTITVEKAKRGWDITLDEIAVTKNPKRTLALLTSFFLLDPNWEGIKSMVAWNGRIPSGLTAWEEWALMKLKMEEDDE